MLAISLVAAALIIPSFASPASRRQGPLGCGVDGFGTFNNASNIFLTALNVTLPNSNDTGVPLVIASTGVTETEKFFILATEASNRIPLEFDTLSLVNGALLAQNPDETAVDSDVTVGDTVTFVSGQTPPAAQIYCGLSNTDPNGGGILQPILSIEGDPGFALCQSGQLNVAVFEPSASNLNYRFDTCYNVSVIINFSD